MHFNFDDYFFRAIPHRTTALYHFDQMPIDPIKIVCLQQEKWISGGKTFDIVCLFCRSYELICAWKGWLYVTLWKLLFVFLYDWHFGGLWTTFLQIIISKFNAMNFHHLFYTMSYLPSYDSTSILKLYLLPSFWGMKHYPNFNCFCVIHSYSTWFDQRPMHDTFKSRFWFSDDTINCRKLKMIRITNWHILSKQIFFIHFYRHFRGHMYAVVWRHVT